MTQALEVAAVLMQGGQRRAWFLAERDLPKNLQARDAVLRQMLARNEIAQSEGVNASLAVVLVCPSVRDECDLEFSVIEHDANANRLRDDVHCGDLAAAVGPYALHAGLCQAQEGIARVRLWQRFLAQRIDALVPTPADNELQLGLEYHEPEHRRRSLLPTGNIIDELTVAGLGRIKCTLIEVGSPVLFIRAETLELDFADPPEKLSKQKNKRSLLQAVMQAALSQFGLSGEGGEFSLLWVGFPRHTKGNGLVPGSPFAQEQGPEQADVLARSMTLTLSGAQINLHLNVPMMVALAAAAAIPGSLVHEITRTLPDLPTRIGHNLGVTAVGASLSRRNEQWHLDKALLSQRVRRLFSGLVHWSGNVLK